MRTSSEIPFPEQFVNLPGRDCKVGKLCEILGWSSPALGRPQSVLSDATLQYRRRKFSGEQDLPLILPADHPTVELCAKYFCRSDRRQKFFPKTPESVANKWPSWPEDSDLIIENLTKLIWVQEYNQRRNADSSERREREKKIAGQDTPKKFSKPVKKVTPKKFEEDEDNIEPDGDDRDDEDFTPKKSTPKPKPVTVPHIKRENMKVEDVLEQRNISDKEANLQFNIKENLDWAYPLKIKVEQKYPKIDVSHKENVIEPESISWIFQDGQKGLWPDEVKVVGWRYMHEHQLYSYKPKPDATGGMAKMLQAYLGITCNDSQFATIFDKSKKFIYYWTRKWYRDYGLLDGNGDNNFRRAEKFDTALRPRREKWLASPEITPLDEDEPVRKGIKRSNESNTDFSSKRQKISDPSDIPAKFHATTSKPGLTSRTPNVSTVPKNGNPLVEPFGKTEVFGQEESTPTAVTMKKETKSLEKTNMFPNINTNYSTHQPSGATKPNGIAPSSAKTESTTTTTSVKPSPSTEQFFKSSHSESPAPGFPVQTPKVNFILTDNNNRLDFKNPVSGIRDLSASDFFELYAKRAEIPLAQLTSLTFVVVFANRDEIEVTRWGGEDSWRSCKKRVTNFFLYTRKHNPEETDFEVWVMNTSKTVAAPEVEDDEFAGL